MTNVLSLEELGAAERIALAYTPGALKNGFAVVLLLDHVVRHAALGAREPMLIQIRLAWWRDELGRLSEGTANHPVLRHLARQWPGDPGPLVALVDAWEKLSIGDAFMAGAESVAKARSDAMGTLLKAEPRGPCLAAARCWSLVDLAALAPDAEMRAAALESAGAIPPVRLPANLRPLAILAGLARRAVRRGEVALIGDRLSPLAAMRLGIFGR